MKINQFSSRLIHKNIEFNINKIFPDNKNLLHINCYRMNPSLDYINLLLFSGCDVKLKDKFNRIPIHIALSNPKMDLGTIDGMIEIMKVDNQLIYEEDWKGWNLIKYISKNPNMYLPILLKFNQHQLIEIENESELANLITKNILKYLKQVDERIEVDKHENIIYNSVTEELVYLDCSHPILNCNFISAHKIIEKKKREDPKTPKKIDVHQDPKQYFEHRIFVQSIFDNKKWEEKEYKSKSFRFGVKDESKFFSKKFPNIYNGSQIKIKRIGNRENKWITKLENSGGLLVGLTSTPELSFLSHTRNFKNNQGINLPTKNPIYPGLSVGGSSGGSAAAVASNLVDIALGTGSAGSISIPSTFCGVIGLNTPTGSGFFVRSLDCAINYTKLLLEKDIKENASSAEKLNIGYVESLPYCPIDPLLSKHYNQFFDSFKKEHNNVTKLEDLGFTDDITVEVSNWWINSASLKFHMHYLNEKIDYQKVDHLLLKFVEHYNDEHVFEECSTDKLDVKKFLTYYIKSLFTKYDILIVPTIANLPWPDNQFHHEKSHLNLISNHASYFYPFDVVGSYNLTLPIGKNLDFPISLQIVSGNDPNQSEKNLQNIFSVAQYIHNKNVIDAIY